MTHDELKNRIIALNGQKRELESEYEKIVIEICGLQKESNEISGKIETLENVLSFLIHGLLGIDDKSLFIVNDDFLALPQVIEHNQNEDYPKYIYHKNDIVILWSTRLHKDGTLSWSVGKKNGGIVLHDIPEHVMKSMYQEWIELNQ